MTDRYIKPNKKFFIKKVLIKKPYLRCILKRSFDRNFTWTCGAENFKSCEIAPNRHAIRYEPIRYEVRR